MKTETKGELREKIEILERNLKRCWLCGNESVTMHHTKPGNKDSKIPLCRPHHSFIEGLKDLVKINQREKKCSYMEFNKFLRNYEILKRSSQ